MINVDFVEIATTGGGTDFGDLTYGRSWMLDLVLMVMEVSKY